ncbi:MAG: hypothetical protein AAFP68_13405 [Pseudomonadota bacterium]
MTNDQIASKLDDLNKKLVHEFARIDTRFNEVDTRLTSLEKHSVTRSDVHSAVFQGLAFAAAAIVGTVVVLNSIGAFG